MNPAMNNRLKEQIIKPMSEAMKGPFLKSLFF